MKTNKSFYREIKKYFQSLVFFKYLTIFFRTPKKNEIDIIANFKEFIKEQEREINELKNDEETLSEYIHDSSTLFEDYFIPHHGNNFKPKILHPKSLLLTTCFLLLMKLSISGYVLLSSPTGGKMAGEITDQILVSINKDRVANNLPALKMNSALSKSALSKADDMISRNYFAHYSPDGKKPWDWVNRAEYPYLFIGENLAMNFTTSDSVHNALMLSPTHKKNILGDKYTDVGLAVVAGEIDGKSTNVLVQMFGARKEVVIAKPKPEIVVPVANNTAQKPKSDVTILGIDNKPNKTIAKKETVKTTTPKISPTPLLKTSPTPTLTLRTTPSAIVKDDDKVVKSAASKEVIPQIATSVDPMPSAQETASVIASSTASTSLEIPKNNLVASVDEIQNDDLCMNCAQSVETDNQIAPVLLNNKIISVNPDSPENGKYALLLKFANYVYIFFLIFMSIALMLKIFINISIQHKSVIVQTVLLLIFIVGLINVNSNFLETIKNSIFIM